MSEGAPNYWNDQATDLEAAKFAVWSVSPDLYDETTGQCLQVLDRYLPDSGKVFEVGCGIGRLAIPIAKARPMVEVVGIDVSVNMMALAREQAKLNAVGNFRMLRSDGDDLPVEEPESFDFGYSIVTFQHNYPHVCEQLLRGVAAALKPGGSFLFQVVENVDFEDWGHVSRDLVRSWVDNAGMTTVELFGWEMYRDWLWCLARK